METYLVATALVALAEMGDRTQILAVMLATRYRSRLAVLAGILAATIANHSLAALAGFYLSSLLAATWFKYVVALSFIAMAVWALFPEKAAETEGTGVAHWGAFVATLVSFFLAEIGDKTQIATMALAARYHSVLTVAAGTTTGMMAANVPAVLLGRALTRFIPVAALRIGAAAIYLGIGVWALLVLAGVTP